MERIKRRDRRAYGEIQKFFRDDLASRTDLGYPLRGELAGHRAVHVCNDRYRIIWRELPEIEDYTGAEDDRVVPVEVVRVGPKTPIGGGTIYEQPIG